MKRRLLLIILAIVVVSGMLIMSCGKATTTTPATTAPVTTTAPKPTTTAPVTTTTAPVTTAPATQAAPYGTLTIANSTFGYETFDPIVGESFWAWCVDDPLVIMDDNGNAKGVVADSWTLSPDGNTWTFKIHKGIKFTNGDPLTSADVQFSVQHYSDNKSTNPWSNYLRYNFVSSSCPDDYTYVYVTQHPEPSLILPFSYTRILPKTYFNKVGQDAFRLAPIGSGPYKLVKWVPSTSCTFIANLDYWGKLPAYMNVVDLLIPEEATRVGMVKSGAADIALALSPDRIVEMQKQNFALQEYGLSTLSNINFPGTWETTSPTSDIKVRQAMSYSVNRQEMCDTYYKGLAKPGARWFLDPSGYGWDPTWKPDVYDVAKAKQLLSDAGYPGKFANPVIQLYAQAGAQSDFMQMLQGYWKTVGIQTKLTIVDATGYLGLFFYGKRAPTDANIGAVIPWIYGSYASGIYHSANMYCSYGAHSTGGPNEALAGGADSLYKTATSDLDSVKAKTEYQSFLNYAYNMWVSVGMVYMPTYAVTGPNCGKFTAYKSSGIYYGLAGIQHPTK